MSARRLAAVLFLTACSDEVEPFHMVRDCMNGIIPEDQRDCACLNEERLSAERGLARLGLRPPEEVTVWIHASDTWMETDHDWAYGLTIDAHNIELERYGVSWLHELLHSWELQAGVSRADTAAHHGWRERGWIEAAQSFENSAPHCP